MIGLKEIVVKQWKEISFQHDNCYPCLWDMIYVGDVQLVRFKTWVACKVCNHEDKGQGVMMLIKTFWLMCGEVKKKSFHNLKYTMKVNYIDFLLL
jgi:hypothetical protein